MGGRELRELRGRTVFVLVCELHVNAIMGTLVLGIYHSPGPRSPMPTVYLPFSLSLG